MKKSFFYAMVMACSLAYQAQAQVSLGIRGGLSIPNLSASGSDQNPLNTGYSSRFGADAAVFIELKVTKHFALQPMLEYSSQGGKKDGLQAFPIPAALAAGFPSGYAPTYLYANFSSEAKLDYLMVPVLAKFSWKLGPLSPLRFYVDAGPVASILLASKQVTTGVSKVYLDAAGQQALQAVGSIPFNNTQDLKDQLHSANFGIEGNVGLALKLGHSNIFIEGGGNYGFLNIQKGTQNGKNNTGAATLTAGYAFSIGK